MRGVLQKAVKRAQNGGIEGQPLCGGGNPAMGSQMAQKGIDLSFTIWAG
jgi:hypothetical protein